MAEPKVHQGGTGPLAWAVCASAYTGEPRSGDGFLVQETPAGALIAVVDGSGHGEEAADAAERALSSLSETAGSSPMAALAACHDALRGSRGAAVTVAALDRERGRLAWVAVGNVDAAVLRRGHGGRPTSRWAVPLRGGVVGDRLPPLQESTAPLDSGDTLVSATDGISPAFLDEVDLSSPVAALARHLHRAYARSDDDALVLVARCLK